MKNNSKYLYINANNFLVFIDLNKVNTVFDLIYQLFSELGIDTSFGSNKERYFDKINSIKIVNERMTNW